MRIPARRLSLAATSVGSDVHRFIVAALGHSRGYTLGFLWRQLDVKYFVINTLVDVRRFLVAYWLRLVGIEDHLING